MHDGWIPSCTTTLLGANASSLRADHGAGDMLSERAVELGRLIGQSNEYQAVKRATDALKEDAEATALLTRMERLRQEAQRAIARGEQPTDEMEQELDQLLSKVQVSPAYQRMLVANENFDKVMVQVNQWIMDGIRKGATSSIITLG
ncbi:MAG: YlbF family regulator [Gemmatimonadetes bacterium]|nr:YlbF family regulator [Gemmatimonadota bacterium]